MLKHRRSVASKRIDQLVAHIARAAASCEMRRAFLHYAVARAAERDRVCVVNLTIRQVMLLFKIVKLLAILLATKY